MRKQIAAANWKMNLTYQQAEDILKEILTDDLPLESNQEVVFAVPFPYLPMVNQAVAERNGFAAAAQNCYHKVSGAYTGEVSADMLYSIGIPYCIVGHSERREYFHESNQELAEKINLLLTNEMTPIFCCGESLDIREAKMENEYVETQLKESLFHLNPEQVVKVVIAYEPIWAIGTGKTATSGEAQLMHAHIRSLLAGKYGDDVAAQISILYGGSVKPSNAKELFSLPDVDGGLVGGASLKAQDFIQIIKGLNS